MAVYLLRFHPGFVEELESAIAYYNNQSGSAAKRFKMATKKQLNILKKTPKLRTTRYDDIRFARIDKFPYAIHYSIDITQNCVLVHGLINDYQNPETYWRKKL